MLYNNSNCTVYDKYFIDDLYPYTFNKNQFIYNTDINVKPSKVNTDNIQRAILKYATFQEGHMDVWRPAIISDTDEINNYRLLTQGAMTQYNNLGVEQAVVINEPQFQNWTFSNTDSYYLNCDWLLNSDVTPFKPKYGILFWYKWSRYSDVYDQYGNLRYLFSEDIPNGAIVSINGLVNTEGALSRENINYEDIIITADTKLYKIDNNRYGILSENTQWVNDPDGRIRSYTKIFVISKFLTSRRVKTDRPTFVLINSDPITDSPFNLSLWIPDGEMYSFVNSEQEQQELYSIGIPTGSYLSPTLKHIYREIYNTLTLRQKKRAIIEEQEGSDNKEFIPTPFFDRAGTKYLKKIAYALATSPAAQLCNYETLRYFAISDDPNKRRILGQTNIDLVKVLIKTLDAEKSSFLTDLVYLHSGWARSAGIDITYPDATNVYNTGYVYSMSGLIQRLMSKYGAQLRITDEVTMTLKNKLPNGAHIKINQEMTSKCRSFEGGLIYNNQSIRVGNFVAETNMDANSSKLKIKNLLLGDQDAVKIPLWDIAKKKFSSQRIPITAGPDIEVDMNDKSLSTTFITEDDQSIEEIAFTLDKAIASPNANDFDLAELFGGETIDVLWTKISGPNCLKFSNYKYSKISGQNVLGSTFISGERYETSSDPNPTIYVKSPGRYVLQLRVRTSFAVLYDTVTIHVLQTDITNKVHQQYFNRDVLRPAITQYLRTKNIVMVPNIRECYFGKLGIFWPSYTDCSVKIPQSPTFPGTSLPPKVVPLGNNYHKFAIPMKKNKKNVKIINDKNALFSITYYPENTAIDVNKISLYNLMDLNLDYANCESLYEGVLDNKGFTLDAGAPNNSFTFLDPSNNDEYVEIAAPDSMRTNTLTYSYGGHTPNEIASLNVNIPFHPEIDTQLPIIFNTGELLVEPLDKSGEITRICHESDMSYNTDLVFEKGKFHPYAGWIINDTTNVSSVIKFDPYHRPVQSFKGPGFSELKNIFVDGLSKTYKSSITLEFDEHAYDPVGEQIIEEIDKKEIADIIPNYGYRSIGGNISLKNLNYNDEYNMIFPLVSDASVSANDYCNSNIDPENYSATYILTRPGTLIPFEKRIPSDGKNRRRWNRIGQGSIGDIEIKINFLNYVNPKDLVIWLEIDSCERVKELLNPISENGKRRKGRSPWFGPNNGKFGSDYNQTKEYISKLSTIESSEKDNFSGYIDSLFAMNDNDSVTFQEDPEERNSTILENKLGKYRIYLLNRDHISNMDYNISLKFSDISNMINNPNNLTMNSYVLYHNNQYSEIKNNTIDLAPTLSAMGYSDSEMHKYIKILKENDLVNYSHSFKKVSTMPIFGPSSQNEKAPGNSGKTKFTLCIAIASESDIYETYDRVTSSDYFTGYNIDNIQNKSNIIDNNICNWELLLHNSQDTMRFEQGDSLGEISYEDSEPSIPGHNFICNVGNNMHLLPPAVINAPNSYMLDGKLCRYSREELNQPTYLPAPKMNILPLLFSIPFSLAGALVSIFEAETAMNEQTRSIVNQLNLIRTNQQLENFNRDWYVPVYDKYPYGDHNKALVSISKDGVVYYKTEASIFRYENSIVLEKNKYRAVKLYSDSLLLPLSFFEFNILSDIRSIYKHVVKKLYLDVSIDMPNIERNIKGYNAFINYLNKKENLTEKDKALLSKYKNIVQKLEHNSKNIGDYIDEKDIVLDLSANDEVYYWISDIKNFGQDFEKSTIDPNGPGIFKYLYENTNFISHSNISEFLNIRLVDIPNWENKFIILDGIRPYYFLKDCRNSSDIELYYPNNNIDKDLVKKLTDSLDNTALTEEDKIKISNKIYKTNYQNPINIFENQNNPIIAIGYIFDGNSYKTLILHQLDINQNGALSTSGKSSNRWVMYRDEADSVIQNNNISNFEFVDAKNKGINLDSPVHADSLWAAGNYGYATNTVRQNLLGGQNIKNKIPDIKNLLDHNKTSWLQNTGTFRASVDRNPLSDPVSCYSDNTTHCSYSYNIKNMDKITQINNTIKIQDRAILSNTLENNINANVYVSYTDQNMIEVNLVHSAIPGIENKIIDSGYVYWKNDISPKSKIYKFKEFSLDVLEKRKEELLTLMQSNLDNIKKKPRQREVLYSTYKTDFYEYEEIEYYIDLYNKYNFNFNILPNIEISYTIDKDTKQISFYETPLNNYYWINIDPEQSCELDMDKTPKILHSVEYRCQRINDLISSNAKHICVPSSVPDVQPGVAGSDVYYSSDGSTTIYTIKDATISEMMQQYPTLNWPNKDEETKSYRPNYVIDRKFFLSMNGKERAQQVIAYYKYIIPNLNIEQEIQPDGEITNKIYNVYNLNGISKLYVDFKKIPRGLRNRDPQFEIYEPSSDGTLTKSVLPSPGGLVDSNLRFWKCIDLKSGKYTKPPNYYVWLNEMIFRLFFGSKDGVEYQGRNRTKSKDDTYWIPYDYN